MTTTDPAPQDVEEARQPGWEWTKRNFTRMRGHIPYSVYTNNKVECEVREDLEAAVRESERTRWAARERVLVEALTAEQAKFQRETLQTDTLLRLVQEASRLWADGDHLYMGQRHEFGRQYYGSLLNDGCPMCWWRQIAADLRTRVTADMLGEARAALGEEHTDA